MPDVVVEAGEKLVQTTASEGERKRVTFQTAVPDFIGESHLHFGLQ